VLPHATESPCQPGDIRYWELQKFLTMALKANPNILECLYSPLPEKQTALAMELVEIRDRLLAVKSGEVPWEEVNSWRRELHSDFERALSETRLPERPDYEVANRFLLKARCEMAGK